MSNWKAAAFALILASGATASPADRPESSDYRARTIYFLLTDRFNAHAPYAPYVDPEYPTATNSINCFVESCTTEVEFRSYWGGDIQGVIQKMDYLRDLGISAVWLTPLMENVRAYDDKGYGTGYHGYWVQNYYRVNEHFGNWNDVNQLSGELHQNGMRYMQDITLNDSNPFDSHVDGLLYQSSDADNVFIKSYADDLDPETGTHYYKHYEDCQPCICAKKKPDYEWSYWQLHHCMLADLSGYDQRNPNMAAYLLGAGKKWIDNGVDDYRLDAVKFPFPEFIATYTHTMRDYLASLDRPAPYIVGEWSHGGVGDTKSLRFANDYRHFGTNILDFQLSLELNRFIGGDHEADSDKQSAVELDAFLHQRVIDFQDRDTWQGTFIDNHDQIRTLVRLRKLGLTDATERERRMDLATVLLMTVRGIPIIYYGDEQYLAYYDDKQQNTPDQVNTGDDDPYNRPGMHQWDENTPSFQITRTLAKLRKDSPAIWKGQYATVYADPDILMFKRVQNGETVIVAVNRGADKTISLPGNLSLPAGAYLGLLGNASDANHGNYLTISAKESKLHLNALSSLVVTFGEDHD